MKKYAIIFFKLALIILLFACTTNTASLKHYKVDENKVNIAWDPATNIPKDSEILYCVYICKSESKDKKGAVPVEKFVNNINEGVKAEMPIADTSCAIELPEKGTFFIGVQTVAFNKNETVVCDPRIINTENRSNIAWSDREIYTNSNPFDISYGEK